VYWCASNKGSVLFMKQNFIKCFGGKISKLQMYIYNKVCERLYTIFFKNFLYGHSLLVMQLTTHMTQYAIQPLGISYTPYIMHRKN
jgi:hypothetical protein